jgi:hypothetical protein
MSNDDIHGVNMMQTIVQIKKMKKLLKNNTENLPVVGLSADEIEIRHGTTYVEEQHMVVGCADGPIAEKDVSNVNQEDIPNKLATKIMFMYLVSSDGKAAVPLVFYPTNKMTGKWLFDKVQNEQHQTENDV